MGYDFSSLGRGWGWFLAGGACYILLGIAALSWPVASTAGLGFALGLLFAVSGFVNLVQAIRFRKEPGTGSHIFMATIALAAGVSVLRYPAIGMAGIALAMTFYFFVSAAAKGVIAFGIRPHHGWGWALLSAVASFALGVYMIGSFPVSALVVPGILLGIDFVIHGSSLIGFSLSLRRFHRRIRALIEEPGETRTRRAA